MMSTLLGDRYLLGEMIGTGGMADVYIAKDQRLSREVAVKILRSDLAKDPAFVARFRKEAKAAAGLNHPGIVAVYDSGEEPAPYIVMELVTGHTLRELIHQGERVSLEHALSIVEQVLAALEYSHQKNIVHRDIKPANVMITDAGDVKVMDFGIARAMDDLGATLTSTWNVVGTAQYLSPEQAIGEAADARSDIYSTGCLLFELLTGQPPFTGETPVSIAYQHVSGEVPSIRALQSDLPVGIETITKVALAKKVEDRYQSAQTMLDDLLKVHQGEALTTKLPSKPAFTKKSAWLYGGSFFVAIAIAVTGYLMSGSPDSGPLVPDVVRLSESQARVKLEGYQIIIKRAHDGVVPAGQIASQSPLATTHLPLGSTITLTISDGPGDAIVPDNLVGMSLIDARAALTAVGLTVSQTIAAPSDQPQGTILEVSPPVGSTTKAGSGVVLTIASGEVTVPNLIGVEVIQAKTILIQAGFLIKEFYEYDSTQPEGVVIRQAPEPDTTQTIGRSVTITINKAP
jgi:serine/threonine-protein kinase